MKTRTKVWLILLTGPFWLPFVIAWFWLVDIWDHIHHRDTSIDVFGDDTSL